MRRNNTCESKEMLCSMFSRCTNLYFTKGKLTVEKRLGGKGCCDYGIQIIIEKCSEVERKGKKTKRWEEKMKIIKKTK